MYVITIEITIYINYVFDIKNIVKIVIKILAYLSMLL